MTVINSEECAEYLKCSVAHARWLMKQGLLKNFRNAYGLCTTREWVDAFMENGGQPCSIKEAPRRKRGRPRKTPEPEEAV